MPNHPAILLLTLGIASTPSLAQAQPAPRVEGRDNPAAQSCTRGTSPEEVVVCGRVEDQERHRLPQSEGFDPAGTVMSVPLERYKLLDQGATGIGSCSTVGPGGWTGCDFRRWEEQRLQYAGRRPGGGQPGVHVRIGPMGPR